MYHVIYHLSPSDQSPSLPSFFTTHIYCPDRKLRKHPAAADELWKQPRFQAMNTFSKSTNPSHTLSCVTRFAPRTAESIFGMFKHRQGWGVDPKENTHT